MILSGCQPGMARAIAAAVTTWSGTLAPAPTMRVANSGFGFQMELSMGCALPERRHEGAIAREALAALASDGSAGSLWVERRLGRGVKGGASFFSRPRAGRRPPEPAPTTREARLG